MALDDKQLKALQNVELIEALDRDSRLVLFEHIKDNREKFKEVIAKLDQQYEELSENIFSIPKGDKGEQGARGGQGVPGKRGERGETGIAGKNGRDGLPGKDGQDGKNGADGAQGDKGDKIRHEWRGTWLRLENPDGTMGQLVNLQGEKGARGENGQAIGHGGASALKVAQNNHDIGTQVKRIKFGSGLTVSGNQD